MTRHRDRIGDVCGLLTVEAQADRYVSPKGATESRWVCRCTCGQRKTLTASQLQQQVVFSCGCQKRNRTPREELQRRALYAKYRASAKDRGYVFEISRIVFDALVTAPCSYCGAAPYINGIDRADNSLGYTEANSVTACKECNWSKGARNAPEFIAWVKRVAGHTK